MGLRSSVFRDCRVYLCSLRNPVRFNFPSALSMGISQHGVPSGFCVPGLHKNWWDV